MFDDCPGGRFPNDENRSARVATLLAALSDFLGDHRKMDGDSWPTVTDGDITDLYDIFGEILDLKYSRDCDGHRAIDYGIASKHNAHFVSFVIPKFNQNADAELSFNEWLPNAVRVADLAASYAKSALDNIRFEIERGERENRENRKTADRK